MRKLLVATILLLFITSTSSASKLIECNTATTETQNWITTSCPLEVEPGQTLYIVFRFTPNSLLRTPFIAARGDYNYTGTESLLSGCIRVHNMIMRDEYGMLKLRVSNSCGEDKYIVLEMSVPKQ